MLIEEGDRVLLYLDKKRKYFVEVFAERVLHTHEGVVRHEDILGKTFGEDVKTHLGVSLSLVKPNLYDVISTFSRRTQVIYPKDSALILGVSSIGPGHRVIEAGTGSGFLTAFLAYHVGPQGKVYSYELRPDLIDIARKNLETAGTLNRVVLKNRDITQGIEEEEIDAVVLDMPTPWLVTDTAFDALNPGGTFTSFSPTINQVERVALNLRKRRYVMIDAFEVILRRMKVEAGATRPETLMIGHTGYIVVARKP